MGNCDGKMLLVVKIMIAMLVITAVIIVLLVIGYYKFAVPVYNEDEALRLWEI